MDTQATVEDRSSEFVAVEGGQETSSATTMLVLAYMFMWGFVFLLAWLSIKKIAKFSSRLDEVETALSRLDAASSEKS